MYNQVLQGLITYEYYIIHRSSISSDVLPKSEAEVAKIKHFSVRYSSVAGETKASVLALLRSTLGSRELGTSYM